MEITREFETKIERGVEASPYSTTTCGHYWIKKVWWESVDYATKRMRVDITCEKCGCGGH